METPEFDYNSADKTIDHFLVDDLLDFPNDDAPGSSTRGGGSYNFDASADVGGPQGFVHGHLSNQLCVPYDEMGELEWVSSFVDESFSSEDLQKLHLISGLKARTHDLPQAHQYHFQPEPGPNPTPLSDMSVPGKARSKRSRAAPGNWASRLLMVSPESDKSAGKNPPAQKKREESSGRKCLHCATEKTPQWRTGPMGPKTLCNACGVRFKSGRLVPEYRPAASPTFVLTKHSNSHRKVLELRRQKEMMQHQHHPHTIMFHVSNAPDFFIHQHIAPQLIRDSTQSQILS